MDQTVVVVTGEPEEVARPVAERHLRVRVVAADGVQECERRRLDVGEVREAKAPVARDRERHGDERREVLEQPSRAVARRDGERGPGDEKGREAEERGERSRLAGAPAGSRPRNQIFRP